MRMIFVTICLTVGGCNGAPLFTSEAGDGGHVADGDRGSDGGVVGSTPAAGAYRVTVTPTSDTCSPVAQPIAPSIAFVLAGLVANSVTVDWPGTTFAAGSAVTVAGFTLAPDSGDAELTINGATLDAMFVLRSRDATGFTVTQSQAWTHVADATAPSPSLPSSDCDAAATLRYDLLLACAAPCVLTATKDPDSLACTCPQ